MRGLIYPASSDAVKEYRFWRPSRHLESEDVTFQDISDFKSPKDGTVHIGEVIKHKGYQWDFYWTNHYGTEGRALAEKMKEWGSRLIVDVDDWFDDVPGGNLSVDFWQGKRKRWYKELLGMADSVVCSTKKLHERYGGTICPNFIDPDEWIKGEYYGRIEDIPRRVKHDEVLVMSCAGSGRAGDFAIAHDALIKALENPRVKVLFMNYMPDWALKYPVGKVIWSRWAPLATYRNLMWWINPDIIISPMEQNEFNEAKSNLKWLESGAVGACFLGERWGEYKLHVDEGQTGVLADGPNEWTEALWWLCGDRVARETIARQGRLKVLKDWTWDTVGPAWRKGVFGDAEISSTNGSRHSTYAVG